MTRNAFSGRSEWPSYLTRVLKESFACPACEKEESSFKDVWSHMKSHKKDEGGIKRKQSQSSESMEKKRKLSGGKPTNVPVLDDYIEVEDYIVKFSIYLLSACVESANENYLAISNGDTDIKFNKRIIHDWIKDRLEESKTFRKRVTQAETMAAKLTMSKKEQGKTGMDKGTEGMDSNLLPDREKNSKYKSPITNEEKTIASLKTELDKLKHDIDQLQIPRKGTVKIDPSILLVVGQCQAFLHNSAPSGVDGQGEEVFLYDGHVHLQAAGLAHLEIMKL